MIVVYVLSNQHILNLVFGTELLKLKNFKMALVWLALALKFIKIEVPFPTRSGILLEKLISQYGLWVCASAIFFSLLPKTILAPECRYAARRTNSRSSHY